MQNNLFDPISAVQEFNERRKYFQCHLRWITHWDEKYTHKHNKREPEKKKNIKHCESIINASLWRWRVMFSVRQSLDENPWQSVLSTTYFGIKRSSFGQDWRSIRYGMCTYHIEVAEQPKQPNKINDIHL